LWVWSRIVDSRDHGSHDSLRAIEYALTSPEYEEYLTRCMAYQSQKHWLKWMGDETDVGYNSWTLPI